MADGSLPEAARADLARLLDVVECWAGTAAAPPEASSGDEPAARAEEVAADVSRAPSDGRPSDDAGATQPNGSLGNDQAADTVRALAPAGSDDGPMPFGAPSWTWKGRLPRPRDRAATTEPIPLVLAPTRAPASPGRTERTPAPALADAGWSPRPDGGATADAPARRLGPRFVPGAPLGRPTVTTVPERAAPSALTRPLDAGPAWPSRPRPVPIADQLPSAAIADEPPVAAITPAVPLADDDLAERLADILETAIIEAGIDLS